MNWKYVLAWVLMVPIGIVNGAVREFFYKEHLGELHAHQVSTAVAVLLLGTFMWFVVRRWRPSSSHAAWLVGLSWLGLTVAFEFLFGHYVMGNPWERLIADYDVTSGRIWGVVLVWVTVAPYLFYRIQSGQTRNPST